MLILGELKAYCLNFRLKGPIISGPQNPQLLTHIAAADITGCYKSLSDISATTPYKSIGRSYAAWYLISVFPFVNRTEKQNITHNRALPFGLLVQVKDDVILLCNGVLRQYGV
jgi:hypothetical protein